MLTAIKKAENADGLLFRFFEWQGNAGNVTLHVPEGATSATITNLMETPEGSPLSVTSNQVTVPITPYQIQTVRVDYNSTVAQR